MSTDKGVAIQRSDVEFSRHFAKTTSSLACHRIIHSAILGPILRRNRQTCLQLSFSFAAAVVAAVAAAIVVV